ncbi:MAG: L,D-transpeptidase family protein [Hyphomicrobiaceae bacterium]
MPNSEARAEASRLRIEALTSKQSEEAAPKTDAERAEIAKAEEALLDQLEPRDLLVTFANQQAMVGAIADYQRIVSQGGWPSVPTGRTIRPGEMNEAVGAIRARLQITDGLSPAGSGSWTFDEEVEAAVKRFQRRHGIPPNGIVDRRTIVAMNVPASARLAQLRINIQRLRELLQQGLPPTFVMVNIPAFSLQAVDQGRLALSSRVIVGREERQTPSVSAVIRGLNFFPYWNVPDSVAFGDLIPKLYRDPGYLARERIRVLSTWGGDEIDPRIIDWNTPEAQSYKFRQDPGPQNALGLVRIDMPNEHIVYMHDTPMKNLFVRPVRAYSAGCVRVQRIFDLVTWIAGHNGDWDRARVDSVLMSGQPVDVKLNEPIPVKFVYLTAWATPDGEISFRADLYGRDGEENAGNRADKEEMASTGDSVRLAP